MTKTFWDVCVLKGNTHRTNHVHSMYVILVQRTTQQLVGVFESRWPRVNNGPTNIALGTTSTENAVLKFTSPNYKGSSLFLQSYLNLGYHFNQCLNGCISVVSKQTGQVSVFAGWLIDLDSDSAVSC